MNLQRRPIVLSSLAALATSGALLAQQPAPGKVWRIGVLSLTFPKEPWPFWAALAKMGYVEGRNLAIDFRLAQGKAELLPGLAAELVAAKPDLLIGPLYLEIAALKRATSTIPIVRMYVASPVEAGLITSLANPGGNLTGTTAAPPGVVGKSIALLRETVPGMSHLVTLINPDTPASDLAIKSMMQAVAVLR